MTVKTKPFYGIGCSSGIKEMSLLEPNFLFIRFCLENFTTLRYKAVNMGTFNIITLFFYEIGKKKVIMLKVHSLISQSCEIF